MKTLYFTAIVFLFIMFSCQDKESLAKLEELKAQQELETQNKDLVTKLIDGFNKQDTSIYEELYAPNSVIYFPSSNSNSRSPEEDLVAMKNGWRAFPDMNWSIEEMIAEGNKVSIRYIAKGTQKEEWDGIPSLGMKVELSGIIIMRFENGKIVEHREDADLLGFMNQLGMELKPKEKKK